MSDDDLNPETRRLVELARMGRTPGDGDKLRLAERLAVPLAASAALGTAAGTAKAAASTGLFSSIGAKIAAVALAGALGAGLLLTQLPTRPGAGPAASAPVVQPRAPEQPAHESPSAARPEPQLEPSEPVTPKASAPTSVHSSKPSDELEQEAALLHEAQTAWRAGQSAKALELASKHAQRFPHSQLANERDVLRVLSLCKLGQAQAAKQVGARLLRTAKGSPWYQSVAESCAGQ